MTLPVEARVIVGAYGMRAFPQALKWRVLVRGTFPDVQVPIVLIEPSWTPAKKREAQASLPPSEADDLHLLDEGEWTRELAYPEAFITIPGHYLRKGGPTDTGWDEFEAAFLAL